MGSASWPRAVFRNDLRGVGSAEPKRRFSIVHHEQHINEIDYNIWTEYGNAAPEFVLEHDGVPIISVYRRPHGTAAQPHAPRTRR